MSANVNNQSSNLDLLLKIMGTANAVTPSLAAVVGIIKAGRRTGKSDAEIEAEAADSMATALRTREKSEQQMGDQP